MAKLKKRPEYLRQLIDFRDKAFIKVITGIRRSGKSSLLLLFQEHLLASGVSPSQIIMINFESIKFDHIKNYKDLYKYIAEKIKAQENDEAINKSGPSYLLLDELQLVDSWERAINSLMIDFKTDIYITGSNAYLLSSELSTLLSGRYVEIKMLPLSFKEYLDFREISAATTPHADLNDFFNDYMRYGGLPSLVQLLDNPSTISPFLEGVYNTVLMKDVVQRNNVRDPALLENLFAFLASNIGSILSTNKVSNYLTSNGRKTTSETIDNYLRMLEKAFIIYKARRFDIRGKQYLKTLEKYYLADMGIRNQLTSFKDFDYGHLLENVVFLELLRRGYEVSIGKIGDWEIDFFARKEGRIEYYQVSATIMDEKTRERELRPLLAVADNYPKYILTMDHTPADDHQGIKIVNIINFLLTSGDATFCPDKRDGTA